MSSPLLTVTGALPTAGAIVVAALPRGAARVAKQVTLVVTLAVFGLALAMALGFDTGAGAARFQYTERTDWIPQIGASYSVGLDGIALSLVLLTAFLMPVVVLASWSDGEDARPTNPRATHTFMALLLVLETMMIGVFAARDIFLFYVFFEAMLIPMYFLIGSYGGPRRSYAAVKFLLYSLLGGLLMLAAVIGLYVVTNRVLPGSTGTFDISTLQQVAIGDGTQKLLFLGFFIAFAIKAPLWPFHTWLPDAAAEAPVGSAVLLVGVLDKVGTFGMIRYCLPLFPDATRFFTPLVLVLSVIGILYGALLAIGQTDLKRLIAYTSVSHFGFIALGIFAVTTQGQSGATLYMVNHGLSTGALFLCAGFLMSRRGSRLIADYGGVQRVAPWLAGAFFVSGLSSLALPGLNSFVSEFLVLLGTWTRYPVAAVFATLGIVLAATYVLWLVQRTMHGEPDEATRRMPDLRAREAWAIAPVLAVVVALGFYPKPLLDVINPAVKATLQQVHRTDPTPSVKDAAEGASR